MIRRLVCLFFVLLLAAPVAAQQNADIDAAARSVVRVVVVPQGEGGGDVGMGSGVAITPTRIVTNAHVVEAAVENDAFVGIVPSEGRRRYIGKVIRYAPELDLAIVEITDGRIEPATLFGARRVGGGGARLSLWCRSRDGFGPGRGHPAAVAGEDAGACQRAAEQRTL
jgi:serine protease Do